jgi:hypothetical protein
MCQLVIAVDDTQFRVGICRRVRNTTVKKLLLYRVGVPEQPNAKVHMHVPPPQDSFTLLNIVHGSKIHVLLCTTQCHNDNWTGKSGIPPRGRLVLSGSKMTNNNS